MARHLRKRESDRAIHAIRSDSGLLTNSYKDINTAFRQFYEQLYTSQCKAPPEIMQDFLSKCNLPTLA